MSTASCLLPIAYCLLPTACCLLPTACCLLLLLTVPQAAAETPQAVPVDGEPFRAELLAVDADWQLTLASGDKRRQMPAGELVWWGRCEEPRRGPLVLLADGSLLVADVDSAGKDQLAIDSGLFGLIRLPLGFAAGVVFGPPADEQAADRLLDRLASAAGDSDLVILTNGDEVAGRIEAMKDDTIRLEAAVGPVDVEAGRTRAVIFNPALRRRVARQNLHAIVGFRDGSRLIADRLLVDGDSVKIEIAGASPASAAAEDLVYLQPLGGRVEYLSDLQAAGYRHVPYLTLRWPSYGVDRNVTGGLLRSGGRLYPKGLGMHSAARLTYLLAEPYRRFQADVAIDDSTGGGGSVRFRVFVDGLEKYTSPTIRGAMPPALVSVDVSGAKRLDLVVDFADRGDVLDRADWLGARLVR